MMALHPLVVPLTVALVLLLPQPSVGDIEGDDYDLNNAPDWDNLDPNSFGESYDYDDLDQEVRVSSAENFEFGRCDFLYSGAFLGILVHTAYVCSNIHFFSVQRAHMQ